jgi:uncharacterized protein (DUF302 family)
MKNLVFLLALLFFASSAYAAQGLITKTSKNSVKTTMDRLEKTVRDKGFNVTARVNHAAAAIKAGKTLRPTEVLIFGNPKLGTLLMQSSQTIGIDLPLKVLVYEDEDGKVILAYNDPAWLARRHNITDRDKAFKKMTGALDKFTDAAVK